MILTDDGFNIASQLAAGHPAQNLQRAANDERKEPVKGQGKASHANATRSL